jgi:3'(2'), 5'-bisphosphate nucleotidase
MGVFLKINIEEGKGERGGTGGASGVGRSGGRAMGERCGWVAWAAVTATESDVELAARLAYEAGQRLLALRDSGGERLGLRGDRVAHQLLVAGLTTARPDDVVLSEEAADDPTRLAAHRVWIIDPLDGTREYAEGRSDWAVHIALWAEGDLVAGAVAVPTLSFVARSDTPVRQSHRDHSSRRRVAVSRTRPPAIAEIAAAAIDAELVPMGSAGYKVLAVARGEVDAYVHAGGQYEWDSAAPVAVARRSGLWTSRLSGEPLRYNQQNPELPDLLVCRPELAGALLAACAGSTADEAKQTMRGGDVVDPRLSAEPAGPAGGRGDLHHPRSCG